MKVTGVTPKVSLSFPPFVSSKMDSVSEVLVSDTEKIRSNNARNNWIVVSQPNSVRMNAEVAALIFLYLSVQSVILFFGQNLSFSSVKVSLRIRMNGKIGAHSMVTTMLLSGP